MNQTLSRREALEELAERYTRFAIDYEQQAHCSHYLIERRRLAAKAEAWREAAKLAREAITGEG
jgi:hypothetical protein